MVERESVHEYVYNKYIDAKFPNRTTGTADKFAFCECENS